LKAKKTKNSEPIYTGKIPATDPTQSTRPTIQNPPKLPPLWKIRNTHHLTRWKPLSSSMNFVRNIYTVHHPKIITQIHC